MSALQGRVAVVTGATAGIGRAVAERLVASGARVVGCGRRCEPLLHLERMVNCDEVLRFVGCQVDITATGTTDTLFETARARFGGAPDLFVINAGRGLPGSLLEADESRWTALFELNCVAAARQMRAAAITMIQARRFSPAPQDLVVMGSIVGRHVSPFNPVYAASKSALHALTEALRREIAGSCVRVTLVEPGIVRTEFQETAGYDIADFEAYEGEIGPFLTADDVARLVAFMVALPPHVHASDVVIRPTRQAYP